VAYRIKVLGTGVTHIHTILLTTSPSFLQIPQGNLYVTLATWRPWVKAILEEKNSHGDGSRCETWRGQNSSRTKPNQ